MIGVDLEKEEQYKLLFKQVEGLLNPEDPIITNLANIIAAINQTFKNVSWVGIYIIKNEKLFLGPFQGKVACTKIKIGKGVCGTSAMKKETIVVPNVHEFPGHIACDIESNSEIVVPIIYDDTVFGVLDLDSTELSTFDDLDKIWLEMICTLIVNKLKFNPDILS
jgi:GAF domain-containing protein